MRSIRFYLIVTLLSTVTLANFAAAVHGYRASMREAQALLDAQLADTATLLVTMQAPESPLSDQPSDRLAFQIWTTGGKLILRTTNSGDVPMTRFEEGYRDANFQGHRWRVLGRFDGPADRWILVAERIDIRIHLADQIILKSVLPIVFSLPVIGVIVWFVVGNGLSLIRKLANELRTKRADDLARLHTANPPVELVPVVDAINDLLRRLDDSVQRERRFSADAAHELRTPLSAIMVHVHNLKRDVPEKSAELQILDRDLGRLGHLIEQIMLLYRTTPEHYQAQMQTLDLHALAKSVIADVYADIDKKGQTISLHGSAQNITGDEASLLIMLRNLILNASKYSPEGAAIQVSVDRRPDGIHFAVADTGPGIPQNEMSRVFDRFYRVGGDRHQSHAEGCGLGLSIAKHIADLHLATIKMANREDGTGLTVSVFFPHTDADSTRQDRQA